jgi:hypothetical protein
VLAPAGGARQAAAQLLPGISHLLAGRQDEAERHLADAAEVGQDAGVDAGMLALAERLRPLLTWALPHLAVQVRLEMARTYLALTDAAAARTILWEVDDLLSRRPRLGLLRDLAAELRAQLDTMRMHAVGASSLTTAEVRLLRLLGTHYPFREIGPSCTCPSTR